MRIHYYKTDTLEAIARNILTRINSNYMNLKPQAVPIESLIEDIYNLNIDYKYLKQFKDELGKMVYDNGFVICFNREKDDYEFLDVTSGTMLIESTLAEDPAQYGRLRFTLAHELAHWILHQNLFKGTGIA
ncbi:MAG: toxin, partial [Clostridia bacterium]|nr:toxin [Clostridia bacterium]